MGVTAPAPSRPGGRSARVRRQVLAAVLEELVAEGYADLRFESVAARAGVHKTTLYRWWPTKAALVSDALEPLVEAEAEIPDTGNLEGDLVAVYKMHTRARGGPDARALTAVFDSAAGNPEVAAIRERIWEQRVAVIAEILERAAVRGECDRRASPRAVCDLLYGAMFLRTIVRGRPLTRNPPRDVLAVVLDGIRR